jgi:hypothetical protein
MQEPKKRLLDDVRGIYFIAGKAISDPPGPVLMPFDKLFEGFQITPAGGLHQQFIIFSEIRQSDGS